MQTMIIIICLERLPPSPICLGYLRKSLWLLLYAGSLLVGHQLCSLVPGSQVRQEGQEERQKKQQQQLHAHVSVGLGGAVLGRASDTMQPSPGARHPH